MPIIDEDTTVLSSGEQPEQVWTGGTGGLKASLDALQARLAVPPRYEVIEELGRGGMGIVYRVRDIETCEVVAIKILKPEIAADLAMRESLRKEVCLARKVTHKNVCRIHEFTRSETTVCVSMEYVCGETLLSKMQRRGALAPVDAVEIAMQICAGLAEAHAQGIVHRDLKPANIVIADDRTVKVMDFGVARKSHDATTASEDLAGTPAYMSPEQLEMKAVTFQTDIYALGMILFEMVTGTQAFTGENAVELALQQIRQEPPRPSSIIPAIPARLDSVILRCLKKNPAERFISVTELRGALEKAVAPATAPVGLPIGYKYFRGATVVLQRVCKDALSDLKLLRKELTHGASQLYRIARPSIENWIVALRSFSVVSRSAQRAQAAVCGAAILAASIFFGLVMRAETHAEQARPVTHVSSKPPLAAYPTLSDTTTSTLPAPVSPFTAKEFDFDVSPQPSDAASDLFETAVADPIPAAVAVEVPRVPRASSTDTKKVRARAHAALPMSSGQTAKIVATSVRMARESVVRLPFKPASLSLLALQPAPVLTTSAQLVQETNPLPNPYLEVGSFNDSVRANNAVNQLSQLGFRARAVRKNHLWMRSYHVEVGPFKTSTALETAEKALVDNGFKLRAVK